MGKAAELINQLKKVFKEDYGVNVKMELCVHKTDNPEINQETARQLCHKVTEDIGGKLTGDISQNEDFGWFKNDRDTIEIAEFVVFYPIELTEETPATLKEVVAT